MDPLGKRDTYSGELGTERGEDDGEVELLIERRELSIIQHADRENLATPKYPLLIY